MTGGIVSTVLVEVVAGANTYTMNDLVVVPTEFPALQVTVVLPTAKSVPEAGEHETDIVPLASTAVGVV
jgi:hypothetical protein